ncbi:MAG: NAD(P)/FAD-dependent oxidoreductase [Pseudomonadota bacterium]
MQSNNQANTDQLDAIVVGAGFAGIYMLYKLRELGLTARVLEAGSGVGGTWYWNRYPGARCDIPSMEYSYQFSEALQQEWEWTERYSSQGEILDYANHVAERFDLLRDMQFDTRVSGCDFDETTRLWRVETNDGETFTARYVVMATGCLSMPNFPNIKGLDNFSKPIYHTGKWPQEGVDFTGMRVGIIGTGSSAVQSIPVIAEQAESLTVFQRTPNYSIPARNHDLDPAFVADIKSRYAQFRADNWQEGFGANFTQREESVFEVSENERQREFEARWAEGGLGFLGAFSDLVFDDQANATARDFFAEKIAAKVDDPELANKLTPDTPIGCKRLCADTEYYETYNQTHVTLIDIKEDPIVEITAEAVVTGATRTEVDALILATGFDAMTGAVTNIDIRGLDGQRLQEKWAAGPKAYLGLATAGFPNLFLITGPGSPSVLSNMLPSIEQHVNWVSDCIGYMGERQHTLIDAQEQAEDEWVDHVNETAEPTIFPHCNSWYLGANIEGKSRVFMPYLGVPPYVEKCNEVVDGGYVGFDLN